MFSRNKKGDKKGKPLIVKSPPISQIDTVISSIKKDIICKIDQNSTVIDKAFKNNKRKLFQLCHYHLSIIEDIEDYLNDKYDKKFQRIQLYEYHYHNKNNDHMYYNNDIIFSYEPCLNNYCNITSCTVEIVFNNTNKCNNRSRDNSILDIINEYI